MLPIASRRRIVVCLGICVAVTAACLQRVDQHVIIVDRGASFEENLQIARAVVTEDRLDRLKLQVKAALPGVTDGDIDRMSMSWEERTSQSFEGDILSRWVTVTLRVQPASFGSGVGLNILEAAAAIIEEEVSASGALDD